MSAYNKGYTLPELLVVLVLVSVLFGLFIPVYRQIITNSRTSVSINQLVAAINYARSEAIRRHTVVTLCKSKDGVSCSGQWSDGWIIFIDKQATGKVVPGDELLRVYNAIPSSGRLEWSGLRSDDYLQMDMSGGTYGQTGTFTYYPEANSNKGEARVVVSLTGRVRIEKNA